MNWKIQQKVMFYILFWVRKINIHFPLELSILIKSKINSIWNKVYYGIFFWPLMRSLIQLIPSDQFNEPNVGVLAYVAYSKKFLKQIYKLIMWEVNSNNQ